jgi:hypothetical protein
MRLTLGLVAEPMSAQPVVDRVPRADAPRRVRGHAAGRDAGPRYGPDRRPGAPPLPMPQTTTMAAEVLDEVPAGGPSPASRSWADNQRCRLGRCGGRDRVGGGCRTGARRTATPRAITHRPHRELPRKPARSKTGNPGTAVARMSPWLNRYRTLATSPAQPTQRQRMPRSTSTLMVTDQAMASSWPRCSPSSAPPNWCWAIQAAATAAWVVGSPAA